MRRIASQDRLVNLEWVLLLGIVVVGILLRWNAQNHMRMISADGVAYVDHASRVLEGRGLFERRGPFFQFLLMISYKVFGVSFESSVLVPQFFGSIIPILLFLLGKHFFDSKTGLVAALLGSLNPLLINLSCWVLRETLSLALILMLIFTAHSTIGIQSKKRSLIATFLPGFLSGLIILTREEMLFIIPPAYILYVFFYEKRRRDFVTRTCVFLVTTIFAITPWLLYSTTHFGDFFHSYAFYTRKLPLVLGIGAENISESVPGTGATPGLPIYVEILSGLWKEIIALPAIFSLFGFVFLPVGVMFTRRKRAIWIVYLIMGLDMLLLAPLLYHNPYKLTLFPYRHVEIDRIIFSGVMPANVIVAYGIRRFTSFLSVKER